MSNIKQNKLRSLLAGRYGPIADTTPPAPPMGTRVVKTNLVFSTIGAWQVSTDCCRYYLEQRGHSDRLVRVEYSIKTFKRRKCLRYQCVSTEQQAVAMHIAALSRLKND